MFSCLITPLLAYSRPYVFLILLPPFSPLPPLLPLPPPSPPHLFPSALPVPRPLHLFPPFLKHALRHNVTSSGPPRPSCAFPTFLIWPLVYSFVSFLSVFFFHQNKTFPFTSNRLFDFSRHPVPAPIPVVLLPVHHTHLVHQSPLPSARVSSLPRLIFLFRHPPSPPFFFVAVGRGRLADVVLWPPRLILLSHGSILSSGELCTL